MSTNPPPGAKRHPVLCLCGDRFYAYEAKVTATCTFATAFQEFRIEPDAVQEVEEFCMGCSYGFALAIEICFCMDLDGIVRVDVLEEPFELNGFRQVIVLLGDAADEESF